jgi:hypothetical protein
MDNLGQFCGLFTKVSFPPYKPGGYKQGEVVQSFDVRVFSGLPLLGYRDYASKLQ